MHRILRRLSYANVASTLALFLALGGTAYAANGGSFLLGRNNAASVTSILTDTGASPALTLRPKAGYPPIATSSKVKSPNLNADLIDGLDSTQLARVGGSTGFIVADDEDLDGEATATCPAGTRLTGGGGIAGGADNVLWASAPAAVRTWGAAAVPAGEDLAAYAICYSPTGAVPGATPLSVVSALQQKALHARSVR